MVFLVSGTTTLTRSFKSSGLTSAPGFTSGIRDDDNFLNSYRICFTASSHCSWEEAEDPEDLVEL